MNDIASASRPAPGGLFVIACPTCFGHVAASAGMAGQPACCPLCAGTFVVPLPQAAPPPPPAARPAEPPVAREAVAPPQVATRTAALEPAVTEAPPAADDSAVAPPADDPFAMPALQAGETAPAVIAELRFQEPVKTVGRGANTIELHRLTDEARRIRRGRRNILLLLVGAAILMIIVMIFGTQRRKR